VSELALLQNYLIVGALLFGIGLIGFLARRNMIVMFLCAEMMLQGVSVSLVAWGRFHNDFGGQMLVLFIIAVAACEAAVALALILMLFQKSNCLDVAVWQDLREANLPPFEESKLPETPADQTSADETPAWPHLPPAGIQPPIPEEETEYRRHV